VRLRAATEAAATHAAVLVEEERHDPSPITLPPPGRIKGFTMAAMRLAKRERLAAAAASAAARAALPRVIRVADNGLAVAAVEAGVTAVEAIASLVSDEHRPRGVFHCQLSFGADGVAFAPSRAELAMQLHAVISNLVSVRCPAGSENIVCAADSAACVGHVLT
jgi:hypothetical protein